MIRNRKKKQHLYKKQKIYTYSCVFFFRPHKQQQKVGKDFSVRIWDAKRLLRLDGHAPPPPPRPPPPPLPAVANIFSSPPLVPPGCRRCAVWTIGSNNIQMYRCTVEMHTSSVITMRPTKKHGSKKSRGVLQVRQAASQMCIQTEGRAPSYPLWLLSSCSPIYNPRHNKAIKNKGLQKISFLKSFFFFCSFVSLLTIMSIARMYTPRK